jgi:hypothetical protein
MDRKAYQHKALKCIRLADNVEDPAVRLKMLAIAQRCLVLASAEKRAGLGIERHLLAHGGDRHRRAAVSSLGHSILHNNNSEPKSIHHLFVRRSFAPQSLADLGP